MTDAVDHTVPTGPWEFDAGVASVFDDMLSRSIPDYETMRGLVTDLGMLFRRPGTAILDLGCSRGGALAPFVARYGEENLYVGVDVSQPMLAAARARFGANRRVSIERVDLRTDYPNLRRGAASVTLCVLTLQFTPIEYRQEILQRIYDHACEGGALLLVEKVLGTDSVTESVMRRLYYQLKADNGYSVEEIERKRLALEGVLVPVSIAENERMLRSAGFAHVEPFWKFLSFCGWLAVRGTP